MPKGVNKETDQVGRTGKMFADDECRYSLKRTRLKFHNTFSFHEMHVFKGYCSGNSFGLDSGCSVLNQV